uniref:Cyclin-dependent kinase inhibitor domain-containing protein n=1 Tax=Anopheles funestus TaxID=62324 RepID=A0A4Y0BEB9_ANOFN
MGAQVYTQRVERLHYSPAPPAVKLSNRLSPAKCRVNRTKRQLFGSPKSDELKQFCNTQLQLQEEEKRKKWNFDFRLGRPMDGPLQWEQVNRVPVVMLTQAAHVLPLAAVFNNQRTSSISSEDSWEDLMDERAERPNRGVSVDSLDESPSSTPSALSPAQVEKEAVVESVQTYPILPKSLKVSPRRISSPKPSSSKGSKLRQPTLTELLQERKRRPNSSALAENSKKVRMLMEASASSDNGVGEQQQQQPEASTSSAN